MYCKKCGKRIDDDSEFCMYCGAEQMEYEPEEYEPEDYEPEYRQPEYRTDSSRKVRRVENQYEEYEPVRYRKVRRTKEKRHFPFGIILMAVSTVAVFLLVVALTKSDFLKNLDLKKFSLRHHKEVVQEEPGEEGAPEVDPIVGSYTASSAVYNGMKMNKLMLKAAGYSISFDVREDGSFTAALNEDVYEGMWYKDGAAVEFYSGNLSMAGEFADGVLSLSDDNLGIAVVLEK